MRDKTTTVAPPAKAPERHAGRGIAPRTNALIGLQQSLGNQAMLRWLEAGGIQAKLRVSQPGDADEIEADRVAESLVSQSPGTRVAPAIGSSPRIQRAAPNAPGKGRTEASAQEFGKSATNLIVEDVLAAPGRTMDDSTRRIFEPAFGCDFGQVRIHEDSQAAQSAAAVNALAYTLDQHIVFAAGQYAPGTTHGNRLLAHELTHTIQQTRGTPRQTHSAAAGGRESAGTVQRQKAPGNQPVHKPDFIPIAIVVVHDMSGEEFEKAANLQVFGVEQVPSTWNNIKKTYTKQESPVTVLFESTLWHRLRGKANAARGIESDSTGQVAGSGGRAKAFQASPASPGKTALIAEIDRRYHIASGTDPNQKIAANERGKAELWRSIRDEVLFEQEYIANLPDRVKQIIRISIRGRDLTPADYDQLFRIGKMIEALPPGAAADYASKVTGTTTDLSVLETAIENYQSELETRKQADAARVQVQNKLLGLDEVYKLYRRYVQLAVQEAASPQVTLTNAIVKKIGVKVETASDVRNELEAQLKRYNFASVEEFASYIQRFEKAFEDTAAQIVLDLLAKYAGKLYSESQRYQDPAVVKDLYGKLAGYRSQYAEFEKNAAKWNAYAEKANKESEEGRLPGSGHIHVTPPTPEEKQAGEKATAAKAGAAATIKGLSNEYPIFAEDELPVEKRLNKEAVAKADESQLGGVLLAHIANRQKVVAEARAQLMDNHDLIFKMTGMFPEFYARMDIAPGSVLDSIIKDKMHDEAIQKLVVGILLAVVAIALSVVSLGTATPAIVAAGASVGLAGLSAYMVFDEYKRYTAEHALAEAGYVDDPSVIWLALAILGAGIDAAGVAQAIGNLAPAARALEAGGDLADFTKAVEALRASKKLDEKIAEIAEKAAAARKAYTAAKGELAGALGKAYSFPGPLTDPEVYRALVKVAAAKVRISGHSLAGFLAELKQARLAAKLAELSPEELVKAKQAFEQAERLANLVSDTALLEKLLTRIGDAQKLERLLGAFTASEVEAFVDKLRNPDQIVVMLDHLGKENTQRLVRQWITTASERTAKGNLAGAAKTIDKADNFLDNLTAGLGKELAETSAIGAQSIIIDSNTAIALMKDADPALKATMNSGEIARVAYIKGLKPGTELRIGNVTVGEAGGALKLKGVAIDVVRDSPEYVKVLDALDRGKVGGAAKFADKALVADAFFAKTEPGVTARFLSADQDAVNALARMASPPIDVNRIGGFPGLLKSYGVSGFNVTIEGRTLTVIPVP